MGSSCAAANVSQSSSSSSPSIASPPTEDRSHCSGSDGKEDGWLFVQSADVNSAALFANPNPSLSSYLNYAARRIGTRSDACSFWRCHGVSSDACTSPDIFCEYSDSQLSAMELTAQDTLTTTHASIKTSSQLGYSDMNNVSTLPALSRKRPKALYQLSFVDMSSEDEPTSGDSDAHYGGPFDSDADRRSSDSTTSFSPDVFDECKSPPLISPSKTHPCTCACGGTAMSTALTGDDSSKVACDDKSIQDFMRLLDDLSSPVKCPRHGDSYLPVPQDPLDLDFFDDLDRYHLPEHINNSSIRGELLRQSTGDDDDDDRESFTIMKDSQKSDSSSLNIMPHPSPAIAGGIGKR